MKILTCLAISASLATYLSAQTIEDGVMVGRHNLFTGLVYSYDRWDHYWQGHLNRTNGNLGTVTTKNVTWSGNFGVSSRLNVIALVPYVSTDASQGVLAGLSGYQDATLGIKYAFIDRPFTELGSVRAIAVVSGSIPLTNYNPDFLPLSIGDQSRRIASRFTLNFQANWGWYLNGTAAYTWRDDVRLDRPYYYTNDKLYLTDLVEMPGIFGHVLSAGYLKHGVMATLSFAQQRTQGGGDIRRQDMPFISNKMNFSKFGAMLMVPLPKLRNVAGQFAYNHTLDGRNVGEARTFTMGLMYTLHFHRRSPRP